MKQSKVAKKPIKLLSAVIGLGVISSMGCQISFADEAENLETKTVIFDQELENQDQDIYKVNEEEGFKEEEDLENEEETEEIILQNEKLSEENKTDAKAKDKDSTGVDINKITEDEIKKLFNSLKYIPTYEMRAIRDEAVAEFKAGNLAKAKELIDKSVERNRLIANTGGEDPAYNLEVITKVESGDPIKDEKADYTTIASEEMEVTIDKKFPRIKQYKVDGHTLAGEENYIDSLYINNVLVKPLVEFEDESVSSAIYKMKVKDEENLIDAELDVRLNVINKILEFNVTRIQNNNDIKADQIIDDRRLLLETIDFRGNNLVSVSSDHKDAKFDGSQMSTNVRISGDRHYEVTNPLSKWDHNNNGYMYAFVSDENTVASVWSNSQYDTERNSRNAYTRVIANKETIGNENYVGLASNAYYYQRAYEIKDEKGKEIGKYKVYAERTWDELPQAKVILAGDLNENGVVDWQDGAIAYRDIMNNPMGAENTKNLVAQRIAMNFGSHAQNPFLMTLDNIKKVNLSTDGLGQMVLLKGYGSEGHDSGHLNYADIGQRIGGPKDMKYLLENSTEYGAKIGVHVNASETYPESKYFNPERLRKNDNGDYDYGWNWIDQAINIDASYDLADDRFGRFKDFKKALGTEAMDFVYIDVWGNGQSGDNQAWPTRVIAREVMDLGWRPIFEWGHIAEYDSTFQHWAADLTYGGFDRKGVNSDIARFIRNHLKDSWVGHYPEYGGAAINPLLGGYDMRDFEGWQGRSNYIDFIQTMFKTNLPSKYIQHFEVIEWKNGDTITMENDGIEYPWSPEMYIKLKGTDGILEIKRLSNDHNDPLYSAREMYLDGRKIFNADGSYLIPWNNDANGNRLAVENEKMYFYNPNEVNEAKTFKMPKGWGDKAYLYRLTDLGRVDETEIKIVDGTITIDALSGVPYVLYKSPQIESEEQIKNIQWSEGMHIYDTGFNSGNLVTWFVAGDKEAVSITRSQADNPMLMIKDNDNFTSLTNSIKNLKPNTSYALYTGVDNRSKANVILSVDTGYELLSNKTNKSLARNYVQAYEHNTLEKNATVDDTSYFQNLYVYFTTGDNVDDIRVSISKEAGNGAAYIDGFRVVENKSNLFNSNQATSYDKVFHQDFENQAQGIFPFVIGSIEGVKDNRTHLSEKNYPYTQRGWNGKVVSDVIDGKWSIKTNGLVNRSDLVYQTIPQNYRFEKGVSYEVEFDYEAGSNGTYAFVVGSGDWVDEETKKSAKYYPLENTWEDSKEAKRAKFTIEGNENEDLWIGIYSTDKEADTKDKTGAAATFASYGDFMLDNLTITPIHKDGNEIKLEASTDQIKAGNYNRLELMKLRENLTLALNMNMSTVKSAERSNLSKDKKADMDKLVEKSRDLQKEVSAFITQLNNVI